MVLEMKISQSQTVSQNLIQQVKILQMSALELTDYMKDMSLENPLVELEDKKNEDKEQERLQKLEWLSSMDEQNRIYYRQESEDFDRNAIANIGTPEEITLKQDLMDQLIGIVFSRRQYEILEFIADSLDSRGYFVDKAEEAAARLKLEQVELKACLEVMKGLEPAGVCAANLSECLWLQLNRQEVENEFLLEKVIVKDYLELLGKNQLHVIARKMKLSVERIQQAKEKIQTLNPKPGMGYSNRENLKYLKPDVTIVKMADYFEILLDDDYPAMRINKQYMSMLRNRDCEREVHDYLLEKMRQIEQVQKCITRRNSTLLKLARFLVEEQKLFFQYGKGHLHTLCMWEAAEKLDVHESTISRAVKDKYLQCCWGIFPLAYFFSKGFCNSRNCEVIATEQIKQQLKRTIDGENKKKPCSDQKLKEALAVAGMRISRRTVAKYRESMDIPDCRGRKDYT